jgi:hypothetical protein
MKDVNKYTTSNLNFGFSFNTELEINQIFSVTNELNDDSSDGLITAIANEFITWSKYFTENRWGYRKEDIIRRGMFHELLPESNIYFFTDYDNYTDEYKTKNKYVLYTQELNHDLYVYVGLTIQRLISGTIWDIPGKKQFTDIDKDFILDSLRSDYDLDESYILKASAMIDSYKLIQRKVSQNRGISIRLPLIGERWKHIVIDNNSDFMYRLQSYFNGAILIPSYYDYYKIYLPFYK